MCLSVCCIYFTHMLQVFYLYVAYACNDFQVFLGVLQVFHLFRTHVANISSRYYKSRSDVAHIAMHVRSGGGASGPCTRSGAASDVPWACKTHAGVQTLVSVRMLALPYRIKGLIRKLERPRKYRWQQLVPIIFLF